MKQAPFREGLQTVALAKLIEDMSIYPRHSVDSTYVGQLVEALRAGATPPPPLVERDTLRIVDGWHRVRARIRRVLGDEGSIQVEVRQFKTPAEVVRTAVAMNMNHGRKLDRVDRVRCAMMLGEAGFERNVVALTLQMREEELPKLVLRMAPVPAGTPGAAPGTNQLPLKISAAHLAGTQLTTRQAEAMASMPGTSLSLLAKQLLVALEHGFVDRHNEHLMTLLRTLHGKLGTFLNASTTTGDS